MIVELDDETTQNARGKSSQISKPARRNLGLLDVGACPIIGGVPHEPQQGLIGGRFADSRFMVQAEGSTL